MKLVIILPLLLCLMSSINNVSSDRKKVRRRRNRYSGSRGSSMIDDYSKSYDPSHSKKDSKSSEMNKRRKKMKKKRDDSDIKNYDSDSDSNGYKKPSLKSPPYPVSKPCSFNKPMDIAVIIDNTGGLTEEQCGIQLNNIADLLVSVTNDNQNKDTRIALIGVNGDDCDLLVPLDSDLNTYFSHYLQYIKTLECKNGFGQTKLGCGILKATQELSDNGNTNAQKKIISISNCVGNDARCSTIANNVASTGIQEDDVIFINAIGGLCGSGSESNIIPSPDTYPSCITRTICVANEINNSEFHKAINHCQPSICKYDNDESRSYDSDSYLYKGSKSKSESKSKERVWWKGEPTPKPTPKPTEWPTPYPTDGPTEDPTPTPTPDPTDSPTGDPTPSPTSWPTDWPTSSPTEWPTKWKKDSYDHSYDSYDSSKEWPSKKQTDSPTPDPTDSPTGDPTSSPTSSPTDLPTPSPTEWPTKWKKDSYDSSEEWPSKKKTDYPTPEPTQYPTDEPSTAPTEAPSEWPTPAPSTPYPTTSPVKNSCPYEIRKGLKFDFIVLYDNTCGLSEENCDKFLEGVTEIIGSVLDYPHLRVQTMQFEEDGDPKTIVEFENESYQKDKTKYAQKVRKDGECTDGGDGNTDLKTALLRAGRQFDLTDDRIDRVIIVSACMDEEPGTICGHIADGYDGAGIEVWAVNLMKASGADNVLSNQEWADDYLSCLVDDDDDRICTGDDKEGVNLDEFDRIIDKCLSPYICVPPKPDPECIANWGQCGGKYYSGPTSCCDPYICNRQSEWYSQCVPSNGDSSEEWPTKRPTKRRKDTYDSYDSYDSSKEWPTQKPIVTTANPTYQPTPSPTNAPTSKPTHWPTPEPTPWPTEWPSFAPTTKPTNAPSSKPTEWPTPEPTPWPTEWPSFAPTAKPTNAPSSKPTEWPTPEPTPWPTEWPSVAPNTEPTNAPSKRPTEWPTPEPTPWPTEWPSMAPNAEPTPYPTKTVTEWPTKRPTDWPTKRPTKWIKDSYDYTDSSEEWPTPYPTDWPTPEPSKDIESEEWPTPEPTEWPTASPTENPTKKPTTRLPTTAYPTEAPTEAPSELPTETPSDLPTEAPTNIPTIAPTMCPANPEDFDDNNTPCFCWNRNQELINACPTGRCMIVGSGSDRRCVKAIDPPSDAPTVTPTTLPTDAPSELPTPSPTDGPMDDPTEAPTTSPTDTPTELSTPTPTDGPMDDPTEAPSEAPTELPTPAPSTIPSDGPMDDPTEAPSVAPTESPTEATTNAPTTMDPSPSPSTEPSPQPTDRPTEAPSELPTEAPTDQPTDGPAEDPTEAPSEAPSDLPTNTPSELPTDAPTEKPTDAPEDPTEAPTEAPTDQPTDGPAEAPSDLPTNAPSELPTEAPTDQPTEAPAEDPTEAPSEAPTAQPTDQPTTFPTPRPTSSPIRTRCTTDDGETFDYVIVYDDSCNLVDQGTNCENYLNGIGDLIRSIKDDNAAESRVAVISYTVTTTNVLIDFDSDLQNDVDLLVNNVTMRGCGNPNPVLDTDLIGAVLEGGSLFMGEDDTRNRKMIVINGCKVNIPQVIDEFCNDDDDTAIITGQDIKIYLVNLIRISTKNNVIQTVAVADDYAGCLARLPPVEDDDDERICVGKDSDGVEVAEFDTIIDDCLIPVGICEPTIEVAPGPGNGDGGIQDPYHNGDGPAEQCLNAFDNDERFDFVLFIDNSCSLSDDECNTVLQGAGKIISNILSYPNSKVATIDFGEDSNDVELLVDFLDEGLQKNPTEYKRYVIQESDCTDNGNDETDLSSALKKGFELFPNPIDPDDDDDRKRRFIILSACRDTDVRICRDYPDMLDDRDIEVYIVNLVTTSNAENALDSDNAKAYLSCLVDDDDDRVCVNDQNTFDDIIDTCLLEEICDGDDDGEDSVELSTAIPTPDPTGKPTNTPTMRPVTSSPTKSEDSGDDSTTTKQPEDSGDGQPDLKCDDELRDGLKYDYVIFIDNSCKLSEDECDELLDGISDIVSMVFDYPDSRVGVVQFGDNKGSVEILIDLNDDLQNQDSSEYIGYLTQNAKCGDGGSGKTDLVHALKTQSEYLDYGDKVIKYIIVSACKDESGRVCEYGHNHLLERGVEPHIINLIPRSTGAKNAMSDESDAKHYLSCLTKDKDRICTNIEDDTSDSNGIEADDFDDIIDECLYPEICKPPTKKGEDYF
eukprot:CAMPEP_0201595166 /NCGR_PEP_ID=MMETSP0190_2-20130828/192255_1 /ASSEMBLY_ACC=CAM_ASM_000263 /TAXON_ID=37353 /ORGANISM="Rosalina sp." /LENGTH=2178 /DNA_ID=CAMNT_0048055055 /DNA_START=34 /DNA_END=6570 /DNA_ORIENTATION=-